MKSCDKHVYKITYSLPRWTFFISFLTFAMEESIFARKSADESSSSMGEQTDVGLET